MLFGPFRFDLADKVLSRDGEEIRLPPRALALLEHLVERPQRIVSKQELLDVVWKDAFVGESSLTEAIGVLRQALGDSASGAGYIQTVHRRGYRFVAPLRSQAGPMPEPAIVPVSPAVPPGDALNELPEAIPNRRSLTLAIAAVALTAVAVVAAGAWLLPWRDDLSGVTRSTITLPATEAPAPGLNAQPIAALSPDGRRIVYVAGAPGSFRLFLRSIDQFEAIPLPGTDGGFGPFFSPDGSSIGFFVGDRLFVKKLPDGQAVDLGDAGAGFGGWWHTDGTILFATGVRGGLFRIPATGGERQAITVPGFNSGTLRHPTMLADGRTIVATEWGLNVRDSRIVVIDLKARTVRPLARGVYARAIPDGRIVYLRDGNLVATPLDGSGPETPLISGIMTGVSGAGQYALSSSGTLLYVPEVPGRLLRRLVRISVDGKQEPLPFEPRPYQNAVLSPDGRRLLATIYERGASDLWLGDLDRGVLQRLTSEGGSAEPVWSRDGSTIYFTSRRAGPMNIYRMPADGASPASLVSSVPGLSVSSVTRDDVVLALRLNLGVGADILRIEPDGTTSEWLATPAAEGGAQLSPDDLYVAYQSEQSGRSEVYVRDISGWPPERQVSLGGGARPGWSADGRYIFFTTSDRRFYRVAFNDGVLSRPEELFANNRLMFIRPGPDGIIGLLAIEEERPLTTLNLVVGWASEVSGRQ